MDFSSNHLNEVAVGVDDGGQASVADEDISLDVEVLESDFHSGLLHSNPAFGSEASSCFHVMINCKAFAAFDR